jgi:hypothetical protein
MAEGVMGYLENDPTADVRRIDLNQNTGIFLKIKKT